MRPMFPGVIIPKHRAVRGLPVVPKRPQVLLSMYRLRELPTSVKPRQTQG